MAKLFKVGHGAFPLSERWIDLVAARRIQCFFRAVRPRGGHDGRIGCMRFSPPLKTRGTGMRLKLLAPGEMSAEPNEPTLNRSRQAVAPPAPMIDLAHPGMARQPRGHGAVLPSYTIVPGKVSSSRSS